MKTQIVGMKDFRQNFTNYVTKGQKGNITYIVLKKNEPALMVRPLKKKEFIMEELLREIAIADEQIKNGEVYTSDEVRKSLGIE